MFNSAEKKFNPLVSIVIPVFNGSNYLAEAIDSALAQTYENIEIIVVNDGSNDGGKTEAVALRYGESIRYYSKENGGAASALNFGINKMRGEYFSWLSHDDLYTKHKIKRELRALADQADKTMLVIEGSRIVDRNKKYLYHVNLHNIYDKKRLKNGLFCVLRGGIDGCAMLIHKSHFERVGLFNEELWTTQDYDMWFRMFRGQNVLFLPSSNVLSRTHGEQSSKSLHPLHVDECDNLWITMFSAVTKAEQIEMCGSPRRFFEEGYEFLATMTEYDRATEFMRKKMLDERAAEGLPQDAAELSSSENGGFSAFIRILKRKLRSLYYKITSN